MNAVALKERQFKVAPPSDFFKPWLQPGVTAASAGAQRLTKTLTPAHFE
jgi:hypothetical protein